MLDIKRVREDFDGVKAAVERRGKGDFGLDKVKELDVKRRELLAEVEQMKNRQKTESKKIPALKKAGESTDALMAEMKKLSDDIKELDEKVQETEASLKDALLNVPNTPHPSVPEGKDDADNVELRKWGEPRKFDFEPKAHWVPKNVDNKIMINDSFNYIIKSIYFIKAIIQLRNNNNF